MDEEDMHEYQCVDPQCGIYQYLPGDDPGVCPDCGGPMERL